MLGDWVTFFLALLLVPVLLLEETSTDPGVVGAAAENLSAVTSRVTSKPRVGSTLNSEGMGSPSSVTPRAFQYAARPFEYADQRHSRAEAL